MTPYDTLWRPPHQWSSVCRVAPAANSRASRGAAAASAPRESTTPAPPPQCVEAPRAARSLAVANSTAA